MFSKLEFNNLVISNKKQIQKARAQTISKLVNKLRKLKDAQQKHPENEKFQERIRKTVECITELKSFKCLHIMRSLLLQIGKNPNAVLTNGRATPDEIAIAMLGLNKISQTLVATFQKTLQLDKKGNEDWRSRILETSKRRQKLEKTEQKRLKRKEIKEQKAQTRNRLEWLEQNKPKLENGEEANIIGTAAGQCTVEDALATEESDNETTKLKEKPAPKEKAKEHKKERKERQKPEGVKNNIRSKEMKQEKPKRNIKEEADKLKSKEIKKESTNASKETDNFKPKQAKKEARDAPKVPEKERPTHVVDPFFITDSGQPYLSTAVVLSGDSNNESDEEDRGFVEQRKRKPLAKKQDNHRTQPNESRKSNSNFNERRREDNSSQFNDRRREDRSSNFNSRQADQNSAHFNQRHPSWLAKEQQKTMVSDFKGKKTKFSEEGNVAEVTVAPPPAATAAPPSSVAEGMHPSWVAKQRLKPKIAEFAGKKIKFDD